MANIYGKDTANDWLLGTTGNDNIKGFGGNDTLKGGGGADYLQGGPGIDTALYTDSTTGVFVDLYYGDAQYGTAQGDTFSGIENVTASPYVDRLNGDNNPNALTGMDGHDHLNGRGGADVLDGGYGDDDLDGGPGADIIYGGPGLDTVRYVLSTSGVHASLGSSGYGGEAHGDRLFDVENLVGSFHNDILDGSAVANVLNGEPGDDVIYGFGGNDALNGNFGNDLIFGHGGRDQLVGADGMDALYPGLEADRLNGGLGGDRFAWNGMLELGETVETFDLVEDFSRQQGDLLDFSGIDANETLPGDQPFRFIGTGSFTGPGQIRYEDWRGNTYIYVNTDADLSFEAGIRVNGLHAVGVTWFSL